MRNGKKKKSTIALIAVVIMGCLSVHQAQAQTISLDWPIECEFGKNCVVQNYVDEDSTASARDFTCGPLTYDQHKGTDIRLLNEAAMRKGVNVLAAADGVVRGVRDGMNDVNVNVIGKDAIKNRECGNGVVLDHAAGYDTQYCHMMKGSIVVTQGQKVKAGDVLGKVGMSGATEFPHLHFQVSRLGKILDPYTGASAGSNCGQSDANSLWREEVKAKTSYISSFLLGHGFVTVVPKAEIIRNQASTPSVISRSSPALIYWADVMGARVGDTLSLAIYAPSGNLWATRDVPFNRNQALSFSFVGKKATPEGLIPGVYTSKVMLKRAGKDTAVFEATTEVNVE